MKDTHLLESTRRIAGGGGVDSHFIPPLLARVYACRSLYLHAALPPNPPAARPPFSWGGTRYLLLIKSGILLPRKLLRHPLMTSLQQVQ